MPFLFFTTPCTLYLAPCTGSLLPAARCSLPAVFTYAQCLFQICNLAPTIYIIHYAPFPSPATVIIIRLTFTLTFCLIFFKDHNQESLRAGQQCSRYRATSVGQINVNRKGSPEYQQTGNRIFYPGTQGEGKTGGFFHNHTSRKDRSVGPSEHTEYIQGG